MAEQLDGLRDEGIPVMVARPIVGSRGRITISAVAELVYWLRTADATVVHIPAGDAVLAHRVQRARRFARGVETIVEVSRT